MVLEKAQQGEPLLLKDRLIQSSIIGSVVESHIGTHARLPVVDLQPYSNDLSSARYSVSAPRVAVVVGSWCSRRSRCEWT